MKILVFSFDDGTIYDKKMVEVLHKYGFTATFNLNSELDDFVWYSGDHEIRRLVLKDNIHLYDDFEVASHSCHHPSLTDLDDEALRYEIGQDKKNLETLFGREVVSFAIPFTNFDERTKPLLKELGFTSFRIDEEADSFDYPSDPYAIKDHTLSFSKDPLEKLQEFINDPNKDSCFVYAGHSYDFEVRNSWGKFERFCQILSKEKCIHVMSMKDMIETVFPKKGK